LSPDDDSEFPVLLKRKRHEMETIAVKKQLNKEKVIVPFAMM